MIFISVIISFLEAFILDLGSSAESYFIICLIVRVLCVWKDVSYPLRFGLPSIAAFSIAALVWPTNCSMDGSYVMPTGHRWLLNPLSILQVMITLRNMDLYEILFRSMFVTFPFSTSIYFISETYVCCLRRIFVLYTHFWTVDVFY